MTAEERVRAAFDGWITDAVIGGSGKANMDVLMANLVAAMNDHAAAAARTGVEGKLIVNETLERAAKEADPKGIHHLFPATAEQRQRQSLIRDVGIRIAENVRALKEPT